MRKTARVLAWLGPVLIASAGFGDEPRPAVAVRLIGPDRQVERIIGLFRGSKAPHPAAALAAWKRASAEPDRLGKPLEALIAAINPRMAGELRSLEGAELAIGFEPETGRPDWRANLPHDEGTIAALGSAMVLSGGEAEPPLAGLAVDRLGPPGSPLMTRSPVGLAIAGTREGLRAALGPRPPTGKPWPAIDGLLFRVDAEALGRSKSLAARRVSAALLAARIGEVRGSATLDGSDFRVSLVGDLDPPDPDVPAAIDPGWLDWIPADRAMAAFAIAIDRKSRAWEAGFRLADRVEKVDPARANLAPIRIRLDLLARSVGVRTEVDVLPNLAGVSGWIGATAGEIDGALIALHLTDEAAAGRLFERVRPPGTARPETPTGPVRSLGLAAGRPIRLARRGPTVVVAWGEGAIEAGLGARDDPRRSARGVLTRSWDRQPPGRAGGLWPGRIPGLVPAGSPIARTLAESEPILWAGHRAAGLSTDEIRWNGLDASVRRFLERIPLDPPTDH